MRYLVVLVALWTVFFVQPPSVSADNFNPVVIYQGSIEDNPFNASAHKGVALFTQKTGLNCTETVADFGMDNYLNQVKKYADDGYSPIIALYGSHFPNLVQFVRNYSATRFILLDAVYDEPNMFSFVIAEHEGSFLAGALAAMASKSKIIGFVSVNDIPHMRRFWCGYVQGAKYVDPQITVLEGFTGIYDGAWFDGKATATIANDMMDKGADVIFQAAGGAGPAVLAAVAARGKLGIGVDVNQNGLYPGHVLTSLLKRTDKTLYAALMLAKRGIWRDNFKRLGLEQDVVGLAFDEHNESLITLEMRARIEVIKKDIILGLISIHDYSDDLKCPPHASH
ncbi:basic membrane protein A [Desulfuromusa kysingii]|uniref:Basic membrane protein A n=1 Tax=Desulfuromusa kysingii TaxID=37625 RepID=A0A1H4BMM1_9BACT|nr:BMP family ABC transporter substrate-binding protein [Desulfuromusa kysingii]SEA49413.1 basic membrane protein A [Desulfuromusa kysingii]